MVSARAELQSNLQAADLFGAALGRCDNGVILLDGDAKVAFWNNWIADASAIPADAALGRTLAELFPDSHLMRVNRAVTGALAQRQASVLSRALNPMLFPLYHRNARGQRGGAIEHQAVIKPLDTRKGRFCLVQIFDVTDAVHRERYLKDQAATLTRLADELGASELRLRHMLDASPIGVAIVGRDGRIQFANRRLAEIFLASPDAISGSHTSDYFIEPTDLLAQTKGGVERLDVRFRRKDGSYLWAQVTGEEIRYEDAPAVLCWVYDISEQKRTEMELVGERDKAEQIARSRTDFLAMVSHEIRTPLNGILGTVRMLGDTGLDAAQREFVDTIQYSGEALLTILNEVLDLSKFEAGKIAIEANDFDIRRLVDSMMMLMSARAVEKNLELTSHVPAAMHSAVVGDAGRLRQVLLNLVGNAIKFTERGSVALNVERIAETDDTLTLRFSVKDTGIGVPEDVRDRLFTEFYQVDPSISRRFGGTGLGLAICRRIVEAMGGMIGVESQPGEGSTFWFSVTLTKGDSERAATARATRVATASVPALKVLLVEDNEINQKVALGLLARDSHKVKVAVTGLEAVAAVAHDDFDLVLMDVQLPEMDGIEATRRIRQMSDPAKATVPILALTANAMADDIESCLAAGMNDVIAKPVDPERLSKAILGVAQLPELPIAALPMESAKVATTGKAEAAVDWRMLQGLRKTIGAEKVDELLDLFRSTSSQTLDEMQGALDEKELERVRELAHRVKGAALNLGLTAVSDMASAIEGSVRAGGTALALKPMVANLADSCEVTLAALEAQAGARREPATT